MQAYYPQSPNTRFRSRPTPVFLCRHRLLPELLRSLIAFAPPAFVLDPRIRTRASPSPPLVHIGSWHSIARPCILRTPSAPPSPAGPSVSVPAHSCCIDYGLFNCSIHHRHSWSWCYRGCWHQPCPPIYRHSFVLPSSPNCLPSVSGQFPRLLPSMDVGAISQAPSPVSDPRPPSPVAALVVLYTTNKLIGLRLILLLSHCFPWLSPQRADHRSITEPFAVHITSMHG